MTKQRRSNIIRLNRKSICYRVNLMTDHQTLSWLAAVVDAIYMLELRQEKRRASLKRRSK